MRAGLQTGLQKLVYKPAFTPVLKPALKPALKPVLKRQRGRAPGELRLRAEPGAPQHLCGAGLRPERPLPQRLLLCVKQRASFIKYSSGVLPEKARLDTAGVIKVNYT